MKETKYGIMHLAFAPLRAADAHRSEMVSQLLFGELYEVLQTKSDWLLVKSIHDGYEGWLAGNMFLATEAEYVDKYLSGNNIKNHDELLLINNNDYSIKLPLGATLPLYNGQQCYINQQLFTVNKPSKKQQENAVEIAKLLLHTPYLWGGRSSYGIDCSGLVQTVMSILGISMPRDAYQQAEIGTTIHFLSEAKANDLVFFDNAEGKITHVGILIDNEMIIHASGNVRIDKIDHQGIYKHETKQYTHNLRLIKRL